MALVYTAEGDGEKLGEEIRKKVIAQGGTVTGTQEEGGFKVSGFSGNYSVTEGRLTVTITSKPVFVPDSMILGWLKDNLG